MSNKRSSCSWNFYTKAFHRKGDIAMESLIWQGARPGPSILLKARLQFRSFLLSYADLSAQPFETTPLRDLD